MSGKPFRLGLIGLGIMGAPMARRLAGQGWQVTAWNLEPERFEQVKGAGVAWADSPRAVAEASDVVMICVLGDDAIKDVVLGDKGVMKAADGLKAIIDFSTTSPAMTEELAGMVGDIAWIDSPMSGGPQAADDGKLTLMVGATDQGFALVEPVLADLGGNVTRMGDVGAGQTTKVVNQAIVGVGYVLMGEVLALSERAGIDPATLLKALTGGMADSTIFQRIFPQMFKRDFDPPRSYARQLHKDLKSVAKFVASLDLDLPVIDKSVQQYADYVEQGNEMQDGASVSRLYVKD